VPKLPRNAESAAAAIAEHEPRFDDIEWVRHPPTNSASDAPLPPVERKKYAIAVTSSSTTIAFWRVDGIEETIQLGAPSWIYMGRTATSSAPILRAALGRLAPPESV